MKSQEKNEKIFYLVFFTKKFIKNGLKKIYTKHVNHIKTKFIRFQIFIHRVTFVQKPEHTGLNFYNFFESDYFILEAL